MLTRRHLVLATAGVGLLAATRAMADLPPLAKKDTYKVGFAQTESNNPWRLAQTASMQDEAKKLGYQLVYTDAAGSAAKQVADVNSMIAQGVDLIFLPPREEKPLIPAVMSAKKAGIPVILIDRNVDQSLAKPGEDYVTFIGSDFVEEGQRVAEWLAKAVGGKAKIIELEGTARLLARQRPQEGLRRLRSRAIPAWCILASQSGDFARDKGRQVAETLLQAHPDATVVYAHNDEMAMGAIAAIEAAGKVPGKDIIVVGSTARRRRCRRSSTARWAPPCECNPRFGPRRLRDHGALRQGREAAAVDQERGPLLRRQQRQGERSTRVLTDRRSRDRPCVPAAVGLPDPGAR